MRNREIIAEARYHLKGNFWRSVIIMFIVATVPSLIIYAISGGTFIESIRGALGGTTGPGVGTIIFQWIAIIVTWVIASFLTIGEKWTYLQLTDNENLQLKTVFEIFTHRPGRNIWHNILQILLIFIWMVLGIIGVGLLFLLVNWLIATYGDLSLFAIIFTVFISFIIGFLAMLIWFIVIWFWFILSEYVLYEDQAVSAYEALKSSRRIIKGYKWQLFKLAIRLFLPLILLSIVLPIVVIILALFIQEQIWLWGWGLIAIASYIGYFIYTYIVHIRWKASLAVFYQMIIFERFEY